MANIDNRKIEALELLINMFLTTGQYDQAKKSVRALRVLLKKREKANKAKLEEQKPNSAAITDEAAAGGDSAANSAAGADGSQVALASGGETGKSVGADASLAGAAGAGAGTLGTEDSEAWEPKLQGQDVVNSGALSHKAGRHRKERQVDIVKLEAVVNYFAQEYELCINLIDRYEQEHNADSLLKIDFNQAQEQGLPELNSIIELRTMILLKAKCLFLLGEHEQCRNLLKEKLMWQAKV